jgi:hypothetical protein
LGDVDLAVDALGDLKSRALEKIYGPLENFPLIFLDLEHFQWTQVDLKDQKIAGLPFRSFSRLAF